MASNHKTIQSLRLGIIME